MRAEYERQVGELKQNKETFDSWVRLHHHRSHLNASLPQMKCILDELKGIQHDGNVLKIGVEEELKYCLNELESKCFDWTCHDVAMWMCFVCDYPSYIGLVDGLKQHLTEQEFDGTKLRDMMQNNEEYELMFSLSSFDGLRRNKGAVLAIRKHVLELIGRINETREQREGDTTQ